MNINPLCKYALIIGINYNGTNLLLKGCINDAIKMQNYLITYRGYLKEHITMLTDDEAVKPTSVNIQVALKELISKSVKHGARELWLHYSGHGSYVKDLSGDERDHRDEAIVPLDYPKKSLIIDDVLNSYLSKISLQCRLIAIFDSCHSGTVLDLKYSEGDVIENSNCKISGLAILISGSTDAGTSAESQATTGWEGAMTSAFIKQMENTQHGALTFRSLMEGIKNQLIQGNFTQKPLLSSSIKLNLDQEFPL
jgi:hypothetical protein